MRNRLYLLLLILLAACNEGSKFPPVLNNSITSKHVNIPGTRLYVIAPPGFSIAGGYMGLRKSSIVFQVYDLTDGNFFTSTPIYSRDRFEREGAQVLEYKDVVVDGYKGKYIFMKNSNNTNVYTLVFGDSTFCTTVLGIYPDDDDEAGKDLKNAIMSVAYDANKQLDPFSRAVFTINDSVSTFKFSKLTGSAYIYTPEGAPLKFNADTPYVIISSAAYNAAIPLSSIVDTVFKRIEEEHGMTDKDIKNAGEARTYNYPAYEREVYGMANGKLTLLYELAMTKDKNMIVFTGHSKSDFASNIDAFKKLSHTIIMK